MSLIVSCTIFVAQDYLQVIQQPITADYINPENYGEDPSEDEDDSFVFGNNLALKNEEDSLSIAQPQNTDESAHGISVTSPFDSLSDPQEEPSDVMIELGKFGRKRSSNNLSTLAKLGKDCAMLMVSFHSPHELLYELTQTILGERGEISTAFQRHFPDFKVTGLQDLKIISTSCFLMKFQRKELKKKGKEQ